MEAHDHYSVTLRENATGTLRTFKMRFPWEEGSEFWWSEGNYSCDCNRELEFREAGGLERYPETKESRCGDCRFTVIEIKLPSGTCVYSEVK